jgi:hypothetical protein
MRYHFQALGLIHPAAPPMGFSKGPSCKSLQRIAEITGLFYLFFIIILLLYWGYIVTFTKVLTIYHSWIRTLHYSPLSPAPHSWYSFNRSRFSVFIHENIFLPYSPSYTLSLYTVPAGTNPPERTCFTFLFSVFEKRHFCLFKIAI